MRIRADRLHRLVVNAKILQSVKSQGAEFHANPQYVSVYSSDPTTMITDSAGLEEPYAEGMRKWFWLPEKLKSLDLVLRDMADDEIVDLTEDTELPPEDEGDYQLSTYLDLLDVRFHQAGSGPFTVWDDRLAKLRLIKPPGPIVFKKVFHTELKREFLTFYKGPTVRGIVTTVEEE